MKKTAIYSLIAILGIVISSCGSSNSVVSNHGISKRKYTKGYFFQRNSNLKTDKEEAKNLEVKEDKSLAKVDKINLRKANRVANKEVVTSNSTQEASLSYTQVGKDNFNQAAERSLQENLTDGLNSSVIENHTSQSEETMEAMPYENRDQQPSNSTDSNRVDATVMTIILVILAIIIPPLAVFIFEGATKRFWIDLVLAILGYGVGFWLLGGLGWICGLAAVIYALLIVLGAI